MERLRPRSLRAHSGYKLTHNNAAPKSDLFITIGKVLALFMTAPTIARIGILSVNNLLIWQWTTVEMIVQGAGEDFIISLQSLVIMQLLGQTRSRALIAAVSLFVTSAPALADVAVQYAGFTRVTRNEAKDFMNNFSAMWSSISDRLFSLRCMTLLIIYAVILYCATRALLRALNTAPRSLHTRYAIAATIVQLLTILNLTLIARNTRPFNSSYLASNTVFNLEFGAVQQRNTARRAETINLNANDPLSSVLSPSEIFTRHGGVVNASYPLWRRTESFQGPTRFDLTLSKRRPNIILLNLESLSDLVVGPVKFKGGSASFTPCYDRWSSRGIRFDSHYSPGIQTSNSLYTQLLSVKPRFTYEPAMEDLVDTMQAMTLPGILSLQGYHTEFMSAASFEWHKWYRFLERAGFHEQHDSTRIRETLREMEHDVPDEGEHGWGLHDEHALVAVEKRIAELNNEETPFFLDWYSISTHDPYNPPLSPEDQAAIDPLLTRVEDESDQQYLQSVRYSDAQVGAFLDRLEARGLLQNTIVMIMGDHGRMVNGATWSDPAGPISSYDPYSHVPMTIIPSEDLLAPEYRGMTINHLSCHYDIINTIADMIQLDPFDQHGLGSSLKRQPHPERRILVDQPWWGHPYLLVITDHIKFVYNMDEDSTDCRFHNRDHPANNTDCESSPFATAAAESRQWAEMMQNMNNIGYELSAFMPPTL